MALRGLRKQLEDLMNQIRSGRTLSSDDAYGPGGMKYKTGLRRHSLDAGSRAGEAVRGVPQATARSYEQVDEHPGRGTRRRQTGRCGLCDEILYRLVHNEKIAETRHRLPKGELHAGHATRAEAKRLGLPRLLYR
jgi:hypothetical protein